jgi:type IV secretory pathway TrbD component
MTRTDLAAVEGFAAPIKQALWSRIMSGGVPRLWANLWAALCLYVALLGLYVLGVQWMVLSGVVWLLGHALLVALTLWDPRWDDMAMAQLSRKYKAYYDAG